MNSDFCKKIWKRLYNQDSTSPEIELGRVLEAMVDVLVEDETLPVPLEEKWATTYLRIVGMATREDIYAMWSNKVPWWIKDEKPRRAREEEDYERDIVVYETAMKQALGRLLERGVIREEAHPELGRALVLVSN